jgi:23S rRNA (adenine2503-C2)-methyltransferase
VSRPEPDRPRWPHDARPLAREVAPGGIEALLRDAGPAAARDLARSLRIALYRDAALGREEVLERAGIGRRRAPIVDDVLRLDPLLALERRVVSDADGGARLVLAVNRLGGKEVIEAVSIPRRDDLTLCLSSQAGCPLACAFCATGLLGFRANLTAGEIVEQHAWAERTAGKRVTDVVFMGMGEPLLNYDAVIEAACRLTLADGAQVSKRKIVISTAGVVPRIRQYTRERHPFPLFFSIASAIPEKRERLMPIEATYPLDELLDAIREYQASHRRNRFATLAYVAIPGENMGEEDIDALGHAVARLSTAIVDVIPYNAAGGPFRAPTWAEVKDFTSRLRRIGAPVKVRYSSGKKVAAGCGQLAADRVKVGPPSGHMEAPPGIFSDIPRGA